MWATAQKVVPRSIPTAFLRVMIENKLGLSEKRESARPSKCNFHACVKGESSGPSGRCSLCVIEACRASVNEPPRPAKRLSETFCHHFFRPQDLVAPEEATLDAHHNPSVVLRVIRRLIAHHTMVGTVDHL